jgi:site-specific recombinase XerC
LSQHRGEETRRKYDREIQRLLSWAAFRLKKCLSSMLPPDFSAYAQHLADQPSLSASSQRDAFAVISSLLSFLVRHGYLHTMPLFKHNVVTRPTNEVMRKRARERQLDTEQQQALFRWLMSNHNFDVERVRFAVSLMFYLGLRIHEVATHSMKNFVKVGEVWEFHVTGKGGKYEELIVPDALLTELVRYRAYLNLDPMPVPSEQNALLMNSEGKRIGVRRISQLVKDAVVAASDFLEDGESKEQMRACSPHWFRHMFVARMRDMGMHIEDVSKNARHSKIATTYLYMDPRRARRVTAMRDFKMDLDDAL